MSMDLTKLFIDFSFVRQTMFMSKGKKKYTSLLLEYKYVKCVITVPVGFNPSAELLQRTQTDLFHH